MWYHQKAMTTEEADDYRSNLVARIFRIFSVLHGFSDSRILLLIYCSSFYDRLVHRLDDMYGYAAYWAYYQIAEQHEIKPKAPVEAYRSGHDYDRLHSLTLLFEELRSKYSPWPYNLFACFKRQGIIDGMLSGAMSAEDARRIAEDDISKRPDDFQLKNN